MREAIKGSVYEDGRFIGHEASERQLAYLAKLSKKSHGPMTSKEASNLIQIWIKNKETLKAVKEVTKRYGFHSYSKYLKGMATLSGVKTISAKALAVSSLMKAEKDENVKKLYAKFLAEFGYEEFAY